MFRIPQVVHNLVGQVSEDEVVDAVYVEVRLPLDAADALPEAHVEATHRLRLEVRPADLEVPQVGAEVVELLGRRHAMRAGEVGHDRGAGAEIRVHADGR